MRVKSIFFVFLIPFCIFAKGDLPSYEDLKFYSQASQDKFVYNLLYELLGKNDCGYYVEIGAADPIHINNSYFFEKNLKWKGISIDISEVFRNAWRDLRKNPLIVRDATKANYRFLMKEFPRVVDYISIDIDGYYEVVLKKLPFDDYTFKIMTIEHDYYRFGDLYRKPERDILNSRGYYLLCGDVASKNGLIFEDWWIHPSLFPKHILSKLKLLDLNGKTHEEIIEIIRDMIKEAKND